MSYSWNTIVQRSPTFTTDGLILGTGTNCILTGFTIDGNSVVSTTFFEVSVTGDNSLVYGMQIINSAGSGHLKLLGNNSRASCNTITGLGISLSTQRGYGIWAISHATVIIDSNVITGTGIDAIGFDGNLSQVINNVVSGCHCWSSSAGGQIASYYTFLGGVGESSVISGNTVGPGGSALAKGIESWAPGAVVSNNTLYDLQDDAINVFTSGTVVTGNTIKNCGNYGILIYISISDVMITGNYVIDDRGAGAQMNYALYIYSGASDRIIATGNVFSGAVIATISDNSTGRNKIFLNNTGMSMGTTIAASATDLSAHIALFGTKYGLNVTSWHTEHCEQRPRVGLHSWQSYDYG